MKKIAWTILIVLLSASILFLFLFKRARIYSFFKIRSYGYQIEKMEYIGDDFYATVSCQVDSSKYQITFRSNIGDYSSNYLKIEEINGENLIGLSCYTDDYKMKFDSNGNSIPALIFWHGIVLEKNPTLNRFNVKLIGLKDLKNKIQKVDSIFRSFPKYPEFKYFNFENSFESYSTRVDYDDYMTILNGLGQDRKALIFKEEYCNCK